MKLKKVLIIIIFVLPSMVNGQTQLSLTNAIQLATDSSFGLLGIPYLCSPEKANIDPQYHAV